MFIQSKEVRYISIEGIKRKIILAPIISANGCDNNFYLGIIADSKNDSKLLTESLLRSINEIRDVIIRSSMYFKEPYLNFYDGITQDIIDGYTNDYKWKMKTKQYLMIMITLRYYSKELVRLLTQFSGRIPNLEYGFISLNTDIIKHRIFNQSWTNEENLVDLVERGSYFFQTTEYFATPLKNKSIEVIKLGYSNSIQYIINLEGPILFFSEVSTENGEITDISSKINAFKRRFQNYFCTTMGHYISSQESTDYNA